MPLEEAHGFTRDQLEGVQGERDVTAARLATTERAQDIAFDGMDTANERLNAVTAERNAAQSRLTRPTDAVIMDNLGISALPGTRC